jgi:HAMP domain-containing protein
VELLVASVVSLVVFMLFWSLMHQSTEATSRMSEVMKLIDGAMLQARIDEDIRTAIEIEKPELLNIGDELVFYNREYDKITYRFENTPAGGGNGKELILYRIDGTQKKTVVAKRIKKGMFFRTGPSLIEYELEFWPVKTPGQVKKKASGIFISSRVYLCNRLY